MDISSVLILSFASAFLVSVVDYFVDLGIWRAVVALGLSFAGVVTFNLPWSYGALSALGAAFLAMTFLTVIERINFRPGRFR